MSQDKFSLQRHDKRDPFRTPEGYFGQLPETVMNRISQEETGITNRKHFTLKQPVFWSAVASVVLLIGFAAWFQPSRQPGRHPGISGTDYQAIMAEVPETEMTDFLAEEEIDVLNYVELSRSEEELILEEGLEAEEIPDNYSANWGEITDYL